MKRIVLLITLCLSPAIVTTLFVAQLPAVQTAPVARPVAQQPDPLPLVEHRDDKYKDDAKAYCFFGKPEIAMPGNPSAHPCQCHPTCEIDENATQLRWEDHTCEMYCTKSRCLCHGDEEICQPPEIKP